MKRYSRSLRSRALAMTAGAATAAASFGVLGTTPAGATTSPFDLAADQITRVSTASGGIETKNTPCLSLFIISFCQNYVSRNPQVSPDGRFVAFDSDATDLVPGVPALKDLAYTGATRRVYLKDRHTGATKLVSIRDNGNLIGGSATSGSDSFGGFPNADGTKVTFIGTSPDISSFPGGNGMPAVYQRDLLTNRTIAVSDPIGAVNGGLFPVGGAKILGVSADGNRVVYNASTKQVGATGTQKIGGVLDSVVNTYVWTRTPGAFGYPSGSTVSLGAIGGESVSSNGRFLLTRLGTTYGRVDLNAGVAVTPVLALPAPDPVGGTISDDGNRIAFASKAPTLVPGDTNQEQDVFVYTASTGATMRASVTADGVNLLAPSDMAFISGDGVWVTFASMASLTPGNAGNNLYQRNVDTGELRLVSIGLLGTGGGAGNPVGNDKAVAPPSVNADGSIVAFASIGDFVADKTNKSLETYVYNRDGVPSALGGGSILAAAADGGVFAMGGAQFYGSMGGTPLNQPVTGIARTPTNKGYWLTAADGGMFSFGDAKFFGSMGGTPINMPVVGMAPTTTGNGYWEVASDGGIFSFGDAKFYGSMGGTPLNKPVVAMAATPSGKGYWQVASDGGVFNYGDADFYGSTGDLNLLKPIIGITPTKDGKGYYLIAEDGGIFAFGNAEFLGSSGGDPTTVAAGMTLLTSGDGYRIINADGSVVIFNRKRPNVGGKSTAQKLNAPIVGVAAS